MAVNFGTAQYAYPPKNIYPKPLPFSNGQAGCQGQPQHFEKLRGSGAGAARAKASAGGVSQVRRAQRTQREGRKPGAAGCVGRRAGRQAGGQTAGGRQGGRVAALAMARSPTVCGVGDL
jgi:hypothetical protein